MRDPLEEKVGCGAEVLDLAGLCTDYLIFPYAPQWEGFGKGGVDLRGNKSPFLEHMPFNCIYRVLERYLASLFNILYHAVSLFKQNFDTFSFLLKSIAYRSLHALACSASSSSSNASLTLIACLRVSRTNTFLPQGFCPT